MIKTHSLSDSNISEKLYPFSFNEETVYYISNGKTVLPKIYDLNLLKSNLAKNGFDFIHFSHNTTDVLNLLNVYKYYNPTFDFTKELPDNNKYFNYLLDLFGIKEDINDIFIYIHYKEIIIITYSPTYDGITGFDDIEFYFPQTAIPRQENRIFYSRLSQQFIIDEEAIDLDESTQKAVAEITEKLTELKKSGQFLAILPFIQHHINEIKKSEKKLSRLYIDDDYRIFLPDYNNLEIKMSHLTKSLYFLFLIKGRFGLDELKEFESHLLTIYKHISYQENIEKMEKSVSDLIKNENNEIYTHFSRIKSAFCKTIDKSIAKEYYIIGDKNRPKYIQISKSLTNIRDFVNKWFPNDERFSSWLNPTVEVPENPEKMSPGEFARKYF